MSSGQAGFGSVSACAICQAANEGTELSPEIQDQLTGNIRISSGFMVPKNAILPDAENVPDDPILGKQKKEGLISFWGRVLKAGVFAAIDAASKQKIEEPLSKKVAKERKRSRVFAIEDMETNVITPEDRNEARVIKQNK